MKGFLMNRLGNIQGLGRKLSVLSFLAIGIVAFSATANANLLTLGACPAANAGQTVLPCDYTGTSFGTLLATQSVPFTSTLGLDTGTLVSAVFQEAGGTLDFYYQVVLNTTSTNCGSGALPACDSLERETDTNFTGYVTQLDFITDGSAATGAGFVNGTVPPGTADRNTAPGDVIGFNFESPNSSPIPPGQASNVLIISTNATHYTTGNASVIDGGVTTVAAFEPTAGAGVPEPASIALLGFGLVAVGIGRRFKASQRV
jgi:hypothetical protein